jgi:hypothetical protein
MLQGMRAELGPDDRDGHHADATQPAAAEVAAGNARKKS